MQCTVHIKTVPFFHIIDNFKSQKISFKAVKENPNDLDIVSDHFKTQEMCNNAVSEDPYYLQYVNDCFVMSEQAKYGLKPLIEMMIIRW